MWSQKKEKNLFHPGYPRILFHAQILGDPARIWHSKKKTFSPLIDSINAKLLAWKAKFLSFAGCLILIKHVLSNIPIHLATVLPLPVSTCKEIERLMKILLWSGNATSSKPSYVNWATVCLPKSYGGARDQTPQRS